MTGSASFFSSNHVGTTSSDWVTACNCNFKTLTSIMTTVKHNDCVLMVPYCSSLPFYNFFFISEYFLLHTVYFWGRNWIVQGWKIKIWGLAPSFGVKPNADAVLSKTTSTESSYNDLGFSSYARSHDRTVIASASCSLPFSRPLHRSASDYIQVTFSCIRAHS